MYKYIKFITALFCFSLLMTQAKAQDSKTKQDRYAQDTLYDIYRYQRIYATKDSTWTESVEKKIPKQRVLFPAGRTYTYRASYSDARGNSLSESSVEMIATGKRWDEQAENQDVIYYRFPDYQRDSAKLCQHPINPSLQVWTAQTDEGIVENAEEVWMHPIRVNQYKFTEVAPFPSVTYPLEAGHKWESSLQVLDGWGEWNKLRLNSKYKIKGQRTYLLQGEEIACWLIESTSRSSLGKSSLNTLFSPKYGFVQLNYTNYKREKLCFDLVDIHPTDQDEL